MSDTASARIERTGWRRLLRPATLVLAVLAVWLFVVALVLLWARNDAGEGLAMVQEAQDRSSPGDLLEGRATEPLAKARTSFQSSSRLLGSPVLAPLRLLPVLGRQLRSGEALTQAAAEISGIGVDVVAEAKQSLSKPHATGPERIVLMRDQICASRLMTVIRNVAMTTIASPTAMSMTSLCRSISDPPP